MSHYGDRYLTTKEFLDLAKEMKLDQIGPSLNDNLLEYLEEKKLLYPQKKLTYPTDYVIFMTTMEHNEPQKYITGEFELQVEWNDVSFLEFELRQWKNVFQRAAIFHVFDKQRNRYKPYLSEPIKEIFLPWDKGNIQVKIERLQYTFTKKAEERYYAYWQVYDLHQILRNHTYWFFLYPNEEDRKRIWDRNFKLSEARMGNLPLRYNRIDGDYNRWSREFNALSFYIQARQRLDTFIVINMADDNDTNRALSLTETQSFDRYRRKIAKTTAKKFELSDETLFNFLKILCVKYFDFEEQRMDELKDILKKDIYSLIEFLILTYKLDWQQIVERVDRVRGHMKRTLDVIFPNELEEAKEEALWRIEDSLKKHPAFKHFGEISKDEIKSLLTFAVDNNLHWIYYSINKINVDWFTPSDFTPSHLQAGLVTLALGIEDYMKSIIRRSPSFNLVDDKEKNREFLKLISTLFKGEDWLGALPSLWCHTRFDLNTNIEERVEKQILVKELHPNKNHRQIIQMFLICGLIRNYSAHEYKHLYGLSPKLYLRAMNDIISVIWLVWKQALSKGYIKSNSAINKNK